MILTGVYSTVIDWIEPRSRVLDLGTGDGTFLARLIKEKKVIGEGVEINLDLVASCVEKGLTVHQGDILDGLDQYSSSSFDYIILLGTFHELTEPNYVLEEVFRVGKRLIIGYSNFAYWKIRFQMMFQGRTPITESMPLPWYTSPNIQFFSIKDFRDFCHFQKLKIIEEACFSKERRIDFLPNLFADQAVTMLENV